MSQHLFRLCYGVSGDGLKLFIFPHYQTCFVKETWTADVKKGTIKADLTMTVPVPVELICIPEPLGENNKKNSVPDPKHSGTDPDHRT
jgi:hypothetical protein